MRTPPYSTEATRPGPVGNRMSPVDNHTSPVDNHMYGRHPHEGMTVRYPPPLVCESCRHDGRQVTNRPLGKARWGLWRFAGAQAVLSCGAGPGRVGRC